MAQLEHTYKPYTGGQLTGYIPVDVRCRTRHARTDARTHGRTIGNSQSGTSLPDNDLEEYECQNGMDTSENVMDTHSQPRPRNLGLMLVKA